MIRCAMTGQPMGVGDGIYDDGEWISWDWINGQLHKQEIQHEYPAVDPELAMLFEELVHNAASYFAMTGRYLQIWGELGELFAEVKYGIKRHRPHTQGHPFIHKSISQAPRVTHVAFRPMHAPDRVPSRSS